LELHNMGLDNPLHIALLLVVLLLIFGAKRLPDIGRSLGSGLRDFKDAISGDSSPPAELSPASSRHGQDGQPVSTTLQRRDS
jgi:sec-independent protein translocase protein TatA